MRAVCLALELAQSMSSLVLGTVSWLIYVGGIGKLFCQPCLVRLSLALQLCREKKSAEHTVKFSRITTTKTCLWIR